jgi:methionyl-tRNA synthetase
LYTMVLTDIVKRWSVLRGQKAIMCTGTDEHGLKVVTSLGRIDSR